MNVGLLTDTHYGALDDHPTGMLDELIEQFHENDVETVVHLGDVGTEQDKTPTETLNYIRTIFNKLSDFETFLLRGNHDVNDFTPEELESEVEALDTCVNGSTKLTGDTDEMLLVETATVLNGHPVGYIPDDTIPDIISHLTSQSNGTKYVLSHYPLQYTNYYQERPFFNVQPEYSFPINKPLLNRELAESIEDINVETVELICGHLHPPTEYTTRTDPYNLKLTIKEAITGFKESPEGELVFYENETLEPEDFIYRL